MVMLYLFAIREVKNFGVLLTCVDEDGNVQSIRREYAPWLVTVGLPKRWYKDNRKAKVEETTLKRPFVGFTEQEQDVVKFRTHKRHVNTWRGYMHEQTTPLVRQFCEENHLFPGWFDPDTMRNIDAATKMPPNILLASYDVECYSKSREFPDASKESDCITMIATSFQRLHGGATASHVVSLDAKPLSNDKVIVEQCKDEEELLQRFAAIIHEQNPDMLIGYNTDGFDNGYIDTRLREKRTFYSALSRYDDTPATYRASMTISNQSGSTVRGRWHIPGRVCLDILPCVRDYNKTLKYNKRYPSCKLDDVCKQELGSQKTGFTYEEIFNAHETKDAVANRRLVDYNIQDCVLVLGLQTKLQIILGYLQLSEIAITPLQDVIYRGVTCRIMNMFSKKAHDAGYYMNHKQLNDEREFTQFTKFHSSRKRRREDDNDDEDQCDDADENDGKFQGAHCFPVIPTLHTDNVLGVDFASLYPSIIRRYNIDPTLLVLSPTARRTTRRQLTDGKVDEYATFIADASPGPVPQLLTELTMARRAVKRQMKTVADKGSVEYAVLNKRQLALKIMSNACYGFLGSRNSGGLGHPELAAAVTAYGRDLIKGVAKHIVDTYPGAKIVGGDTDSVYFTVPQDNNDLVKSFEIGETICSTMNVKYGDPIELEMEKVYQPMLYVAMKTYAAIMYETPTDKGVLDVKGLAAVKSDTSPLTRKLQTDVINAITSQPNDVWPRVKLIVLNAISTIKAVDKEQLVKSVKLGSDYKNPDSIVQVQVVAKMRSRGQQEPRPGERVQFLVKSGTSKRICDRADHPEYVTMNDIDYDYYIERQIIRPDKRILDIVHKNWRNEIIY